MSASTDAHENHQLGGYKATLHNPSTSEKAKDHAAEILVASGQTLSEADEKHHQHFHTHSHQIIPANPLGLSEDGKQVDMGKAQEHEKRVEAGFKSVLNNPTASDEAKQHAAEVLEANK